MGKNRDLIGFFKRVLARSVESDWALINDRQRAVLDAWHRRGLTYEQIAALVPPAYGMPGVLSRERVRQMLAGAIYTMEATQVVRGGLPLLSTDAWRTVEWCVAKVSQQERRIAKGRS